MPGFEAPTLLSRMRRGLACPLLFLLWELFWRRSGLKISGTVATGILIVQTGLSLLAIAMFVADTAAAVAAARSVFFAAFPEVPLRGTSTSWIRAVAVCLRFAFVMGLPFVDTYHNNLRVRNLVALLRRDGTVMRTT
jgi:hypothetical protein